MAWRRDYALRDRPWPDNRPLARLKDRVLSPILGRVPNELLFTVKGSHASPAQAVTLAEVGLRERRDLQEWVLANPDILGEDLLIVTFEFDRWWSSSTAPADRLDVLALGTEGRLVVAELKRDRAPDTVEMQAIKYAAMASRFTQDTLAAEHLKFLRRTAPATTEEEALARLVAHAGDFNVEQLRRPRIVIAAGEFPPVVTATAVWLTEMGLDLKLVRIQAYRTEHETVVTVSQLFPPQDMEEFIVSPRVAEVKAIEERRERQRDVTTTQRLVQAKLLADGALLRLRPEGVNQDVRGRIDAWLQGDPRRGQARWVNEPGTPLIWEADGQRYSPSGLAGLIVQQAAGIERSIRGGDWWVTEDGRDLVELAMELSPERERLYLQFWTQFAERLRLERSDWKFSPPTQWNWFVISSPLPNSFYSETFRRARRFGSELYIDAEDAATNTRTLAALQAKQTEIEAAYGGTLEWNAPNDRHRYASVFALAGEGEITEVERHEELMDALLDTCSRLRAAIEPFVAGLGRTGTDAAAPAVT